MAVKEVLKEALEAVQWAGIPAELQEIAFSRAIDLLTGSPGATGESTGGGEGGANSGSAAGTGVAGSSDPASATGSDRLKKVADALGVSRDRIELIYVEHEDELQIAADPGVLGSNMKERSKSVGLLLAAGRQLGGWDEGATTDAVVRAEVDRLGVYDGGNYSKYMKDLTAWFNVNGSGKKSTYKLKFQGREHLKTFAKSLAGE